jgi:N-acetylmuramoyl-L-alanine amidase
MVYVPAAQLRKGTTSRSGSVYLARKEVKEKPSVSFSYKERVESEGLSRQLAGSLIDSFRNAGITIHTYKPIRDRITRRQRSYVPAVLRYNEVPAKVLVEVVNLANTSDRGLITTAAFREKVAEALVAGIHAYYGSDPPAQSVRVAKASP